VEISRAKKLLLRLIVNQMALLGSLVVLAGLLFGAKAAYSGFVGGLIWLLPHYYLVEGLTKLDRSLKPGDRLRKIYVKSAIKLLYSVALFVIAIVILQVDFLIAVAIYLILTLASGISFKYSELSLG